VRLKWIATAQDWNQWHELVNMAINRRPKRRGNFWLCERLLASYEGLCSMELINGIVTTQFPYVSLSRIIYVEMHSSFE
jgi:hypothetical protein